MMKHVPLILSVAALAIATLAYARGTPMTNRTSLTMSLDGYDFSTPESAFRDHMKLQVTGDVGAMLEISRLTASETHRTAEIKDTVMLGDQALLFVAAEEDGKAKQSVRGMKKLQGHDVWVADYISPYEVKKDNPDLAKRMRAWEEGPAVAPVEAVPDK